MLFIVANNCSFTIICSHENFYGNQENGKNTWRSGVFDSTLLKLLIFSTNLHWFLSHPKTFSTDLPGSAKNFHGCICSNKKYLDGIIFHYLNNEKILYQKYFLKILTLSLSQLLLNTVFITGIFVIDIFDWQYILNPFYANFPFLYSLKDFLTFSAGIEMEHWLKMG